MRVRQYRTAGPALVHPIHINGGPCPGEGGMPHTPPATTTDALHTRLQCTPSLSALPSSPSTALDDCASLEDCASLGTGSAAPIVAWATGASGATGRAVALCEGPAPGGAAGACAARTLGSATGASEDTGLAGLSAKM